MYCPCDNIHLSRFWEFFHKNFSALGLKKLMCSFAPTPGLIDNSSQYLFIYDEVVRQTKIEEKKHEHMSRDERQLMLSTYNPDDFPTFGRGILLKSDAELGLNTGFPAGDFRSKDVQQYFDEADIVATNPPFSLFREFIATLQAHNNDFLILGNPNAVTYKEFFPLLRDDRVHIGHKPWADDMYFSVTEEHAKWLMKNKEEGSGWVLPTKERCEGAKNKKYSQFLPSEYNKVFGRVSAIWYTTLARDAEAYTFGKPAAYSPTVHPYYDNYDAIEVGKLKNLPYDYFESFAVPATYKEKFNANFAIKPAPYCDGPLQTKTSDGIRLVYDTPSGLCLPTTAATLDTDKQLLISLGIPESDITYRSGVMGVPITYLEKHNPDIFDIVAFRKAPDGSVIVTTREEEREFNARCLSNDDVRSGDLRWVVDGLNRWKASVQANNSSTQSEPIGVAYPKTEPSRPDGTSRPILKERELCSNNNQEKEPINICYPDMKAIKGFDRAYLNCKRMYDRIYISRKSL